MKTLLPSFAITFLLIFGYSFAWGQCGLGEASCTVDITTDTFGAETSWEIVNNCNGIPVAGEAAGSIGGLSSSTTDLCLNDQHHKR